MDYFTVAGFANLVIGGVALLVSLYLLAVASLTRLTLTRRMRLFAYMFLVLLAPLPLAATMWIVSSGIKALFSVFIVLLLWFAISILLLEGEFYYYRTTRKDLERLWIKAPQLLALMPGSRWTWWLHGMDLPGHDQDARQARAAMPLFGILYRTIARLQRRA